MLRIINWEESFPALSTSEGIEKGRSRETWREQGETSATRHRQLPGPKPDNRNVAANSCTSFHCSAQQGCTKGRPTAVHLPSFSLFPLVQTAFCLSFPSRAMSSSSAVVVKLRGWRSSCPPSTLGVCAQKHAGQVSSHHTSTHSPSPAQPQPTSGAAESRLGLQLPAPAGLPAASSQ